MLLVDTAPIIAQLDEDFKQEVRITDLKPTVEGALLVTYIVPNIRREPCTKVACFKHGALRWTQSV